MTQKWIDEQVHEFEEGASKVDDIGFLIRIANENTGAEHYVLRYTPAITNRSKQPILSGWAGSYNNVGTYGEGVWKIIRIAKNGRTLIEKIKQGPEMDAFLEEMGYPDLADDCRTSSACRTTGD